MDNDTTISYYPNMNDSMLAGQMESCVFPNAEFHHEQHLRLAWHYVRTYGEAAAVERMRQTISRYAASLGHPEKYHDTATIGWMRLVAAALRCTPQARGFDEFLAAHAWLLNRDALLAFYSRELFQSAEARARWMAPDLHPLPGCA